jgi:hypothetical protein
MIGQAHDKHHIRRTWYSAMSNHRSMFEVRNEGVLSLVKREEEETVDFRLDQAKRSATPWIM